jgi:hypothetical protein
MGGCDKHKEYGGIRKPRTNCERCWQMWREAHPERAAKLDKAKQAPAVEPIAEPEFVAPAPESTEA